MEDFISDDVAARRVASLPLPGQSFFKDPGAHREESLHCGVCFDEIRPGICSFSCGHVFCADCWEGQLGVKVTERPRGAVECMWPECGLKLSEEALEAVGVPKLLLRKWRAALARPFLDANESTGGLHGEGGGAGGGGSGGGGPRLVHCKSSHCSAVIRLPPGASGARVVCGECSHTFCSRCDYPAAHAPATCTMVATWQEKGGMVEASAEDMAT